MTVQHRISLRSCTWFKSYFHIRKGQRAASFFILSNLALMSSSICKRSILHPESCNWRSCQASQEESWCCLQTTVYQLSSWQMQLKTCQSKTVLNALCSVLEAAVPEFSGANCSRGLVQQTHSHWIHWRRWVNESAWEHRNTRSISKRADQDDFWSTRSLNTTVWPKPGNMFSLRKHAHLALSSVQTLMDWILYSAFLIYTTCLIHPIKQALSFSKCFWYNIHTHSCSDGCIWEVSNTNIHSKLAKE